MLLKELEEATRLKEERLVNGDDQTDLGANDMDQMSAIDFDRMLVGAPNDSKLWVQYMAFHLNMAEISKAKQVAEKALNTIAYNKGEDRMNIWKAYLNMEAQFGDDASIKQLSNRAMVMNDAKVIHIT